eukprot:m.165280 g.165280  ORF g.165280 m.165280 type:complete len:79 (+) comp18133_c0_seq1:272-508(+)
MAGPNGLEGDAVGDCMLALAGLSAALGSSGPLKAMRNVFNTWVGKAARSVQMSTMRPKASVVLAVFSLLQTWANASSR